VTALKVAFFGRMINSGTPRGALRLFRAMADELAARDDVELICLGEPPFDAMDPTGCAFERWDGREFLAVLRGGELPKVAEVAVPRRDEAPPKQEEGWVHRAERYMGTYRRRVPLAIRSRLSGVTRKVRSFMPDSVEMSPAAAPVFHRREFPDTLFRPGSRDDKDFGNADIVGKLITLDRIDVVLDFWWFHSPFANPLIGRYRPRGLRVISWFLDAIPLRIAHWQPGLIPVPEFRGGIQAHLERADEVVAISRSAAADVATFFPHIRKPVHVVPCGIFPEDFDIPEKSEYLPGALSLDPTTPLFTIIGFQEPSKNVPNALRALLKAAVTTGRQLQVFILGVGADVNLTEALGPVAAELHGSVRVIFGGMVSELAKRAVLAQSTALLYPSKWEGFGIPPLEAMAAGTQVITSDIAPLREVCADLAEYCDPYDVESIADAICRTMAKSPADLARYVDRAREHASRYSWRAASDQLMNVIAGTTAGGSVSPHAVIPAL